MTIREDTLTVVSPVKGETKLEGTTSLGKRKPGFSGRDGENDKEGIGTPSPVSSPARGEEKMERTTSLGQRA
jgi:hypothetical protein